MPGSNRNDLDDWVGGGEGPSPTTNVRGGSSESTVVVGRTNPIAVRVRSASKVGAQFAKNTASRIVSKVRGRGKTTPAADPNLDFLGQPNAFHPDNPLNVQARQRKADAQAAQRRAAAQAAHDHQVELKRRADLEGTASPAQRAEAKRTNTPLWQHMEQENTRARARERAWESSRRASQADIANSNAYQHRQRRQQGIADYDRQGPSGY